MEEDKEKQEAAKAEDEPKVNGHDAEAPAPADAAPAEEPPAETAPPPEPTPEEQIAALQRQAQEYRDQLLRAVAEMENLRKRNERQLEDAHKYAVSNFAKDLLNVSDNLRRAIEAAPEDKVAENELLKTLHAGVQAVERDLLAAFDKHGIVKITPLNDRFDPNFHQAMFEVPDSGKAAGTVVQLLQPGYVLNDRLLRPAMVGVAKGQPEEKKVDTTV